MNQLLFALLLLVLSATASATSPAAINIDLLNPQGKKIGDATLTPLARGVKIRIDVQTLKPGEHALHIHQTGSCKAPDFKSAGDHFSPHPKQHGHDSEGGAHAGDMPNLIADAQGIARLEYINTEVTLGKGANSLLKEGGTAIVIHDKPDDYKSQPAGNAGDRIACGEISSKPIKR